MIIFFQITKQIVKDCYLIWFCKYYLQIVWFTRYLYFNRIYFVICSSPAINNLNYKKNKKKRNNTSDYHSLIIMSAVLIFDQELRRFSPDTSLTTQTSNDIKSEISNLTLFVHPCMKCDSKREKKTTDYPLKSNHIMVAK